MADRQSFAHYGRLVLRDGTDPFAPGAAVTAALCGHWEHDGPCRWPHNNGIDVSTEEAELRTVFACTDIEEAEVRTRIEHGLRAGDAWVVVRSYAGAIKPADRELAARLLAGPHL